MKIDLLHNKIVKETATEAFLSSVESTLVPKLRERYRDISLVQMYEDYLKDDFRQDGRFFYPFFVMNDSGCYTAWVSWDVSERGKFDKGVPYALVSGEPDFCLHDSAPASFEAALLGRAGCFIDSAVKLDIQAATADPTFLSGRYSQTFVDEMRRQITRAIEKETGVAGLADSSVELSLVFAPDTYMEHTSENVTYRRLLISAKGCAARDFWVKWTRLDASVAYSVKDAVSCEQIKFEIGEDVSHKIREKEYRFLVYGNSDKYRSAMGRKNITEWRDLIKRAVKRGELLKDAAEAEAASVPVENETKDELGELLARLGVTIPEINEDKLVMETPDSEFEAAMRTARIAAGYAEPTPEAESVIDEDALIMEMLAGTAEPKEDEPLETAFVEEASAVEPVAEAVAESASEPVSEMVDERVQMLAAVNDALRAELEALRFERDELVKRLEALEAARKEGEERLREQLLLETKKNEREKALFAEAARLAKEENERLIREREEAERALREDEQRREDAIREERERAEREAEVRRIEAARFAELEQRRRAEALKADREERARRMAERLLGCEAEPAPTVAPVSAPELIAPVCEPEKPVSEIKAEPAPVAEAPAPAPVNYTYTQKIVRLMFRHNVDPNVTSRIHEMISVALEHFGKQHVYIRIKASIPEPSVVLLNFVKIPEEEMELLVNIIKMLGNSDLGISKVTLE